MKRRKSFQDKMAKRWSLKECHDALGTALKNPRWSWSGRSADGKTVSVQLWQDRFSEGGRKYATGEITSDMPWVSTPGHNELIDNLKWARTHCNGTVKVIIAIAKDKNAHPRSILECFPQKKLHMRVEKLDENSGEFTLERLDS